jgi:hypothetical protein
MTRILRYAFAPLVAIALLAPATGCKTNCTGNTCTSETTVEFVGTPVEQDIDWAPGQPLNIDVKGASVRTGTQASTSITVGSNASVPAGKIHVRFTPINNETQENKAKASTEMNSPTNGGNLVLSAGSANGAVSISVGTTGTHSNGLSATVDITVPAGFDGAVVAKTATGDVSIQAVQSSVTTSTGLGNVAVTLAGVPAAGTSGNIVSDQGDITFSVPKAANLGVVATTDSLNSVVYTENVAGWQEVSGSTAQAARLCGGTACSGVSTGDWTINAKFGSVQINIQ